MLKINKKTQDSFPFNYGWVIVFVSALGAFFSGPGQTFSISIFINYYIEDFGWGRTSVSTIYSTATILAGLLMPIIGRMIDRYGQRKITVTVSIVLGIACLFNSFIVNLFMLFVGFFLLRLFGQGAMSLTPGTLVPQWFIKKRGLALSFMSLGFVLGSAVIPPFNTWMIYSWSWSGAWKIWFFILCFVFAPIAFLLIRDTPEELGLLPDNGLQENNTGNANTTDEYDDVSWTLKEAMGTRVFWFVMFCQAIPSMVNTGIVFHFISIMGEQGIPDTSASFILSIIALTCFLMTFGAGYTADRVKLHKVMVVVFIGKLSAMLMLYAVNSIHMAVFFGVVSGIVSAFFIILDGVIWPNYFGRKHLGSIRGFARTSIVFASAFGPLPFGLAYDVFGGYKEIILIMMIFPVLAIVAAWVSPKPQKNMLP